MNTEERTARTSSQEYSQPIQHNEETADSTNIDDANVDHDYDEPPEDNETIPPTTFQKNNNKKSGNKLNRIRSLTLAKCFDIYTIKIIQICRKIFC